MPTRPRTFGTRALAALVAVALAPAGCSWILVDKPPAEYERLPSFTCTDSYATPGIDTAVAALSLALAYDFGTTEYPAYDQQAADHYGRLTITTLVLAGVYAASAGTGFSRVSQCNTAKAHMAMLRTPPPYPYGYPPYGGQPAYGGQPPYPYGYPPAPGYPPAQGYPPPGYPPPGAPAVAPPPVSPAPPPVSPPPPPVSPALPPASPPSPSPPTP